MAYRHTTFDRSVVSGFNRGYLFHRVQRHETIDVVWHGVAWCLEALAPTERRRVAAPEILVSKRCPAQ